MKLNQWTVALAATGVVSLASAARADEQMTRLQTALSQTTLDGYVDAAAQMNLGGDMGNGGFAYPGHVPKYTFAQDDGFTFNAIDIALDRPEDSSQWSAGYHVELMAGADAVGVPITPSFGLNPPTATVRQAFIRLHMPLAGNGIDWKIGVFDSIIGYESNSDPLNPNYTRSYGYSVAPTTMTGILGTYQFCDAVSLSAGIADVAGGLGNAYSLGHIPPSFVSATAYESQKAYMGDLVLTAPESFGFLEGATLSGGVVQGINSTSGINSGATTSAYVGAVLPTPVTAVKVGACFNYLLEAGRSPTFSPFPPLYYVAGTDDIWVVGAYATIQATDKLSFNFRGEYVSDDSKYADVENLYANNTGLTGANAAEELTATVQYNLWANVLARCEFRWDHVEHGKEFGTSPNVFGNPYKANNFLVALNLIYQF